MTGAELRPTRLGWGWLAGSLLVLAGAVVCGILVGPADLGVGDILRSLADRLPFVSGDDPLSARDQAILWELRMPRVVLGLLVGGMLALSGGAYQGVFRNPLADPYLLGVAAGAGLGATFAIAYGPDTSGWLVDPLPLAAFVGGIFGVALAYAMGHSLRSGRSAVTLILAGVAVAAFLTAAQTYVQQKESETLRQVYGWILGRLSTVGWQEVALIAPYVALCSIAIIAARRLLDVMAVGDTEATALGVDAVKVRLAIVIAATLGTAAVVAVSGLIGFVGIIVPHTVRLLAGVSYRVVLPLSLILGGAFLVLADILARTVAAPAELPIGVVTAFFGAPFFALVLRTSRGMAA
jgi:iron complex transport system permease protein